MIIDRPQTHQTLQLRQLWKEAFGDDDTFLDGFFATGYSPDRCRCLCLEGRVCAALYWFDAQASGQKIAYLYAVATARQHQNRGLCRALMEDTHRHLAAQGYALAILVPVNAHLFGFYEKLGYQPLSSVDTFTCTAAGTPISMEIIPPQAYARRRKELLPQDAVLQEGATLDFLHTFCTFYAGDNFLMAAAIDDDRLIAAEFLGDPAAAPGILANLQIPEGRFRTPGNAKPFTMYYPLTGTALPLPSYFGLALD